MLEIAFGGVRLQLLPQRAAFVASASALLVADAHIGKATSFRRLGVPVPEGTTGAMLATLDGLLAATQARRLVFLGDLLHAARAPATWLAVAAWRARHADVEMTLVRGNHDRHAGDPPADWHCRCVDEPYFLPGHAGLALAHHPTHRAGADGSGVCVLAGHVHPAVLLGGRAHDRLRLPCFHFGERVGVLPAFGAFTGMHVLSRGPGDRIFAIVDGSVRPLNSAP